MPTRKPRTTAADPAPPPTPTPYATGDDAAAAGIPLTAGSALANTIDTEINGAKDEIARRAKRTSPTIDIYVQPTAPPHAVGRIWIHPL
jgi:hypothetical protein